jgi:hypothetical protein
MYRILLFFILLIPSYHSLAAGSDSLSPPVTILYSPNYSHIREVRQASEFRQYLDYQGGWGHSFGLLIKKEIGSFSIGSGFIIAHHRFSHTNIDSSYYSALGLIGFSQSEYRLSYIQVPVMLNYIWRVQDWQFAPGIGASLNVGKSGRQEATSFDGTSVPSTTYPGKGIGTSLMVGIDIARTMSKHIALGIEPQYQQINLPYKESGDYGASHRFSLSSFALNVKLTLVNL